jgi:phage shock protein C
MQASQSNTLFREDTILGVCQALGEDFGFNPLWLRIVFGVLLLWQPLGVIAVYLAAGVLVALTRLLIPNTPWFWQRRKAVAAASQAEAASADEEPELAAAA